MFKRAMFAMLFVVMTCSAWTQDLAQQFADPPHEYSLVPLWSWNSTLDPAELRRQIDEMVDKGVYGAFMHARAGIEGGQTPYFSDGWWRAIDTCMDYGAQVGFFPWIYDEDKWPSGAAGGRTLARNPERNVEKALRRMEQRVTGPATVTIDMPNARYMLAARVTGEGKLDPGSFRSIAGVPVTGGTGFAWECPAGQWLVMGYVFEPLPGHGVNYLNEHTVRDFMDITHEEYACRYGARFGKTVPGIFFDEISNNAGRKPDQHAWVEGFEDRFREAKGYDLAPLLPALSYDCGPDTPRIRCDYYDVYASVYERAWFGQIAEWCDSHGLMLTGHTIEDPRGFISQADYMRTISRLQIPMTDNEDFRYTWPRTIGAWKPKQLASVGHLYGRPRTGVEAMGGGSWAFTPEMGRYGINMLAAYGINFFAPHLFHYAQDTPASMDDWPNSWFFQNPYWKYFKTLADHARRLSFMLTGGQPVVDVAVLYPQANQWAGYGPGTVVDTVKLLTEVPIDVDVVDPPSLARGEVRDGALCVGGMRYRALVVPGLQCIHRSEADKLREFVRGGGTLIVHDRWPTDSAEAGRDDRYLDGFRLEAESKGVRPVAMGDTVSLLTRGVGADVSVISGPSNVLRYCHVRRDGRDLYWVVNSGSTSGRWQLAFRAEGTPEFWQPEDGSIRSADAVSRSGDRSQCAVALDAGQGCFVVFAPPTAEQTLAPGPSGQPLPAPILLTGDWEFLAVGDALDREWRCDVKQSELELPVMRAHWERAEEAMQDAGAAPTLDDTRWRSVKVFDALHPDAGSTRYRSRWEGGFITWNPVTEFNLDRFYKPDIGGKGLKCRTTFTLDSGVAAGRMSVACPSPWRAYVNGALAATGVGGGGGEAVAVAGFRTGYNTLMIEADDAPALLAEAALDTGRGAPIRLFTDRTWQACVDGAEWSEAWEYVAPPEAPYGEPERSDATPTPTVLWLRQPLPPGAYAVRAPQVEGQWQAWANGQPLRFRDGLATVRHPEAPGVLALRITLGDNDHGLIKPVRVMCRKTRQPLEPWAKYGLDWYSGRAVYSRTVEVDRRYLDGAFNLDLDLGRVGFCAEIWVNGKLAGTRIWPPYRVDVSKHLRAGRNRVDIVVANLVANRMRWDLFDDVKGSLQNRKWHDDILRRDAWCFDSGLSGPVELKVRRKPSS